MNIPEREQNINSNKRSSVKDLPRLFDNIGNYFTMR